MHDLFASVESDTTEVFTERAAIAEFDGLLTREQAEAMALTESEAWRHACEVRYIVAMTSNRERVAYVELVAEKRGKPAADRLRADARAEIERRKKVLA